MNTTNNNNSSSSTTTTSKRGHNWSPHESVALCEAWLTVSENGINGARQKDNMSFWEDVMKEFKANLGANDETFVGAYEMSNVKSEWETISTKCTAFAGCLAQIERRNVSGVNVVDKVALSPVIISLKTNRLH